MNRSIKIQTFCIIIAASVLAVCCFANGFLMKGAFISGIGFLWLYGQKRSLNLISSLSLLCISMLASIGIVFEIPVEWMLVSIIAAICAWDLNGFLSRIKKMESIEKIREIENRHLKRLLIIVGISLILCIITLNLEFSFKLSWMSLFAFILAFCLFRIFNFFMREND